MSLSSKTIVLKKITWMLVFKISTFYSNISLKWIYLPSLQVLHIPEVQKSQEVFVFVWNIVSICCKCCVRFPTAFECAVEWALADVQPALASVEWPGTTLHVMMMMMVMVTVIVMMMRFLHFFYISSSSGRVVQRCSFFTITMSSPLYNILNWDKTHKRL